MTSATPRASMDPAELGKLRWRCRRGMRELDVVLTRYLDRDWPRADEAERAAFRELLERQDPEVNALLVGRMEPDNEALARVMECLRRPA
jgi:antitoxin CptB